MSLLKAQGVSFAYGRQPVLREVSLELEAGRIVCLLGPNGSGKSTLIKLLLGHLKGAAGEVSWEERPLRVWRRRELARRVAYLAQSPLYEPSQTVGEVLRNGRAPYWGAFGSESMRDIEVVGEVAGQLQLAELLGRTMDELSGGQRQRVFLGRCLVQQPRAMLLDEPASALDLRHAVDLCRRLRDLATKRGLGVLMASHDLNLTAAFADQIVLLSEGAVAAAGTAAEVLRPELLETVYGVPMLKLNHPGGLPLVFPDVGSAG